MNALKLDSDVGIPATLRGSKLLPMPYHPARHSDDEPFTNVPRVV